MKGGKNSILTNDDVGRRKGLKIVVKRKGLRRMVEKEEWGGGKRYGRKGKDHMDHGGMGGDKKRIWSVEKGE
jgi:hypothetical protein